MIAGYKWSGNAQRTFVYTPGVAPYATEVNLIYPESNARTFFNINTAGLRPAFFRLYAGAKSRLEAGAVISKLAADKHRKKAGFIRRKFLK